MLFFSIWSRPIKIEDDVTLMDLSVVLKSLDPLLLDIIGGLTNSNIEP